MAGAASAHQAATATREQSSQQRTGRTRRTSGDPQRAQQRATADAVDAPAALDSLSRLQQLANASPQVTQLRRLQALADGQFAPVAQLAGGPEEEELIQGKFATAQPQSQLQQAPRVNNTGLPDQLKSGIEALSGLAMDHVRVHYNSEKPAQLNALAYAQGSDIHLAPGQERHLPHEAWHVVQQAQGRVKPTLQMAGGLAVNDDAGLESEADVMGGRAKSTGEVQGNAIEAQIIHAKPFSIAHEMLTQLFRNKEEKESWENYGISLVKEAEKILKEDKKPMNKNYLQECIQGIRDSREKRIFVMGAANNLKKAIERPEYIQYNIDNLKGDKAILTDKQIQILQQRIVAMNDGEKRYNIHKGVGGVPTMDVSGMGMGGTGGRGDVRLQFFQDGTMKLVDHDEKSYI